MLRIDLNSTSLAAAAYSEEQQLLELRFRNGEIYHYFSVPPEIYGDLLRAPSKGAYFNQGIRDRFAYVKSGGDHRLQSSVVPNQPPQPLVALAPHGAECQSPLPSESLTFCGRTFSAGEVDLMRHLASEFSALAVTEIAHTVCELLHWRRPGGGLKSHECRQLLERLAAQAVGTGPGGRKKRKPSMARAGRAISLFGMQRAVRRPAALLGAESPAGTGLSALDLPGLEDAGPRRMDWLE